MANKIELNATTIIIAVLVIAVIAVLAGVVKIPGGTQAPDGKPTPTPAPGTMKTFQGTLSLTIKDWSGDAVTTGLKAAMTKAGTYATIYDARKAQVDDGGLVAPFGTVGSFASISTSAAGVVTFTAQAVSEANGGTDYQLYVYDAATTTGSQDAALTYNALLGKVKVEGHYDSAGSQVVTALIRDGYVGPDVEVSKRGTLAFYNGQADSYAYNKFEKNTSGLTDNKLKFEIPVRLSDNYRRVNDIGVYIEKIPNMNGSGNTIDAPTVMIGGKVATVVDVENLPAGSAAALNKPATTTPTVTTGSDTGQKMYYASLATPVNIQRISTTVQDEVVVSIDTLVLGTTAAATDFGEIVVTVVGTNGHKYTDQGAKSFTLTLADDGGNTYSTI